jgi:ubiquinone/menaquinone biosynthesis C-methylase UbiE
VPRKIAGATRRAYDALAFVYPLLTWLCHSKAHDSALRRTPIRNGMSVLEIAVGSGRLFNRILQANQLGTVVGVDLSPRMAAHALDRALKNFPQRRLGCGVADVCNLPFRNASFDAVMCCYLLELLTREELMWAIEEIGRVLRPGATLTLVLVGRNVTLFNRAYGLAQAVAPAFWGRQVEHDVPALLEEFGMRIVTDTFVRQGFYPSRVLVARIR